jgi:hypothetical protein
MENNRKMATTTTQIFNPSFKNPDDMPVYVSIFERPKKPSGRPKTCKLSDEQKKERARTISRKYYTDNHDYCVLRQFIYDEKKKK